MRRNDLFAVYAAKEYTKILGTSFGIWIHVCNRCPKLLPVLLFCGTCLYAIRVVESGQLINPEKVKSAQTSIAGYIKKINPTELSENLSYQIKDALRISR